MRCHRNKKNTAATTRRRIGSSKLKRTKESVRAFTENENRDEKISYVSVVA